MEGKMTLNQIIDSLRADEENKDLMESTSFIVTAKSEVADKAMIFSQTNFIEFGALSSKMIRDNLTLIAKNTSPHIAYGVGASLIDITQKTLMELMPEDSGVEKILRNMVLNAPIGLQLSEKFMVATNDNMMIHGLDFNEIVASVFATIGTLIEGGDVTKQEAIKKLKTCIADLEKI